MDSQTNIPHNINWYFYSPTNQWYEHYSFWSQPDQVGVNMIRAIVSTNYIGTEEHKNLARNILIIFPNPVVRGAEISYILGDRADVKFKFYDVSGRLIQTTAKGMEEKGHHTLRLPSNLVPGVYFVVFQVNNECHQHKIVVSQ